MEIVKGANLALAFVLELCLLVAFGYWGFVTGGNLPLQILLGIGTPLLVAVVWGVFMAPKAIRPLPPRPHRVVEVILFALGTAALYAAGQSTLALIFAAVFVMNFGLRLLWKQ